MMGLSAELDDIVLPSQKANWTKMKEKWFCKTTSCKIPGLLKIGKNYIPIQAKTFASIHRKFSHLQHSVDLKSY